MKPKPRDPGCRVALGCPAHPLTGLVFKPLLWLALAALCGVQSAAGAPCDSGTWPGVSPAAFHGPFSPGFASGSGADGGIYSNSSAPVMGAWEFGGTALGPFDRASPVVIPLAEVPDRFRTNSAPECRSGDEWVWILFFLFFPRVVWMECGSCMGKGGSSILVFFCFVFFFSLSSRIFVILCLFCRQLPTKLIVLDFFIYPPQTALSAPISSFSAQQPPSWCVCPRMGGSCGRPASTGRCTRRVR
jgi:hypothetical protein